MRIILAVVLSLHGIAHFVGFAIPWRLTASNDLPYRITVLGGLVDLGDRGIRMYGLLWLMFVFAFVAAAVALALGRSWGYGAGAIVAAASALLCATSLPESKVGLWLNFVIIAWIALALRFVGNAG